MKKIILFAFLFSLFSCKNSDLVIQKSKQNCSCIADIENVYDSASLEYGYNSGGYSNGNFNCTNPFEYNSSQHKILEKASSLELVNTSETKVYTVLIQCKNSENISYQTYKIEPSQTISLGCDISFTPVYNGGYYTQPNIQSIGLYNVSNIEYKIHKVKVISEY